MIKVEIKCSQPIVLSVGSFWKLVWLILKVKWKMRSKKNRIYIYSLLTTNLEITDETCSESADGHSPSLAEPSAP